MKEDVIKFRKTCDTLISEKGYNKNRIVIESKLSWPTFKKVIETPIDELKIQASILGFIQDFNRKHCEDFNYSGIIPDLERIPMEVSTGKNEFEDSQRKKLKRDKERIDNQVDEEKVKAAEELSKHPYFTGFWSYIEQAVAVVPEGVQIVITINSIKQ